MLLCSMAVDYGVEGQKERRRAVGHTNMAYMDGYLMRGSPSAGITGIVVGDLELMGPHCTTWHTLQIIIP